MSVLITGGGGFIGSHLVESQLQKGFQVRTVDLHVEALDHLQGNPNLETIQGDITDTSTLPSLMQDITVVYHLASAHLDVNLTPETYQRVNVSATKRLLQAAHQADVRIFVHCSSVGVIGDVKTPPADEGTPCAPTNVYERTKLAGEQAALAYYANTGFRVVVVRPAWVYGPRCPRTSKLLRMINKSRFFFFGDGQNFRHPIYAADCVRGLELAADVPGSEGQIYILAGDRPVTTQELVTTAAGISQISLRILRFPLVLGILAGRFLQTGFGLIGKQPPFSERSLDFFTKNNAYSIEKARRELGFDPEMELEAGLTATAHWMKGDRAI
jgi:nucleoside-diphosphate-sugar epimerase